CSRDPQAGEVFLMANWDENSPGDSAIVSQYPANERAARAAVKAIFGVDHHADDDADQGKHEIVTLLEQTAAPSTGSDELAVYAEDVDGDLEVFVRGESDATPLQLTRGGGTAINVPIQTPIGGVIMWFLATPPAGWLLLNGDTIGSAASGADNAGDEYKELFVLLWDVSEFPVSGNRGDSAEADWAANKTLTLIDPAGRSPLGAGQGAGLTARTAGATGGAETVTLTINQLPSHHHPMQLHTIQIGSGSPALASYFNNTTTNSNTGSTG